MTHYRIVVLPGDGIGPEIMQVTLTVLRHLTEIDSLDLEFTEHEAGASHYARTGEALPAHVLDDCKNADAVLLAAIGLPEVRMPDGTEVQPSMMIGLRRALGLFAAVRPIRLYPGAPTPLKDVGNGIDFVILRENLEGLFASYGGGCLLYDEVATDTMIVTRTGTERVVEYAFHLAKRRKGRPSDGRKLVTCVDKANIFRSLAFFRKVFLEVAERHPDIDAETTYVDAMSLYMVQNPQDYDVCVMENQFGDILSDLGAGLVGGLGLGPSGEIGEHHALFQPSHGTAPPLAGRNVANPLAMILSASMMLDWLGVRRADPSMTQAAKRLESAVADVLADGSPLTRDLGGEASTTEVADALRAKLG